MHTFTHRRSVLAVVVATMRPDALSSSGITYSCVNSTNNGFKAAPELAVQLLVPVSEMSPFRIRACTLQTHSHALGIEPVATFSFRPCIVRHAPTTQHTVMRKNAATEATKPM